MTAIQYGFLALVLLLLPFAVIRWARTPRSSSERRTRGDIAVLIALMVVGQAGALVRDRVLERYGVVSSAFVACNLLLLVVVGISAWLIRRLYRAYRQSQEASALSYNITESDRPQQSRATSRPANLPSDNSPKDVTRKP